MTNQEKWDNLFIRQLLAVIFTAAANWGMYLSFCDTYSYPRKNVLVMVSILFYCVLFAVIFSLPKRQCVIALGAVLLCYIAYFLLHIKQMMAQARHIYQYIECRAQIYYNLISSEKSYAFKHNKFEGVAGQSLILAILFVSVCLIMAGIQCGTRFVTVLLLSASMVLGMFYGRTPNIVSLMIMFVGGVALCGLAQAKCDAFGRRKRWMGEGGYSLLHLSLLAVTVFLSLLVGGILYTCLGGKILQKHEKYLNMQYKLELEAQNMVTEVVDKIRSRAKRMDNSAPNQTGKTIMYVRTDKMPKNSIFWRESSEDTYEGSAWKTKIDMQMQSGEDLKLFSGGYYQMGRVMENETLRMNSELSFEQFDDQQLQVEVKFVSSGDNLIFPYWADMENAYGRGNCHFMPTAHDRELSRDGNEFVFQMYDVSEKQQMWFLNRYVMRYRSSYIPDQYNTQATLLYRKNSTVSSAITDFAEKIGNEETEKELGVQCRRIRKSIWKEVSYNKILNRLPMGADYIENFLFQEREGYCMHYATAGTVLCHIKDIPARFVRGYRLDPSSFRKCWDKNGNVFYEAEVLDTNGHAWTEVYKSHLGWIPVEMTEAEESEGEFQDENWQNSSVSWDETEDDENLGDDVNSDEGPGDDVDSNEVTGDNADDNGSMEEGEEGKTSERNDSIGEDEKGKDSREDNTTNNSTSNSTGAEGNLSGTKGGSDGQEMVASDGRESAFTGNKVLVSVLVFLVFLAVLAAVFVVVAIRKRKGELYEAADRSGKLLMKAQEIGRRCTKKRKNAYGRLSDHEVFELYLMMPKGNLIGEDVDRLQGILQEAAFSGREISEKDYSQAMAILKKLAVTLPSRSIYSDNF